MKHLAYSGLTKRLYFDKNGKKIDITEDVKEYIEYINCNPESIPSDSGQDEIKRIKELLKKEVEQTGGVWSTYQWINKL